MFIIAVASQLQSAMVKLWTPEIQLLEAASAVLLGPGLAALELTDQMKGVIRRLWRDWQLPLVVDASALDWLAAQSTMARNAIRVVTPHPGEAARMLNTTVAWVQADRPRAVRELSRRFGNCWVVLKGHQTLIGRSEGEIFVNPSGNPHLAQGGSGDALAGFHRRPAGATGVAGRRGNNHPLRRLAARGRGGRIAGQTRELGGGRFGERTRQRAVKGRRDKRLRGGPADKPMLAGDSAAPRASNPAKNHSLGASAFDTPPTNKPPHIKDESRASHPR